MSEKMSAAQASAGSIRSDARFQDTSVAYAISIRNRASFAEMNAAFDAVVASIDSWADSRQRQGDQVAMSLPMNDEVYAEVCRDRGKSNLYVSTNAVNDVMQAVRKLALAQQAPDTARDAALEEAAKACAQKFTGLGGPPDDPHPDAVLHNGCVHDCIAAIRALKSTAPKLAGNGEGE